VKIIKVVLQNLQIDTPLIMASQLDVVGESTDLLISICKAVNADIYFSGFGGREYQEDILFQEAGISVKYTDFGHPIYPQLWGDFVSNLSIVDLLFNVGPKSRDILLGYKIV
jgi:hypothetical protein